MIILVFTLLAAAAAQESLSPPYFDIGKGKNISATATCGEDFTPPPGAPGELFCTLAELHGKFGIRGLSCSYCVPGDHGNSANGQDSKDHNIRNANDGSNRWWQSPPLSRGLKFRDINITIDLGQSFHVAYVIIKSANSPRPGVWALERSNDNGKTFHPWHYFAPTSGECREYFGVDSYLPIVRDDTVICSTEYSKIPPFQDGEIHLSLINGRPGATNFKYSKTLQDWTSATNIRLRFVDIKTLLTDLLPLSLEDPTVTRRYYYSIKDISIGGRCMCNGFADECEPGNIVGKYSCKCQYNTIGVRCGRCKSGHVQHKWRPRGAGNENFQCEKCNCHGHTDDCDYDEQVEQKKLSVDKNGKRVGGGVCKNCLHNTHGVNCEKCKPFFYRPKGRKITDQNACQACNCDTRFSTGLCAVETGQCECKKNYAGRYCNQCNKGYHSFPRCLPCECNINGSVEGECSKDKDVGCRCKKGFTGPTCDKCHPGYYGFPNCTACECLTRFGALDNHCERDKGQCRCKRGYSGRECERCGSGYFQFPYCKDCGCDPRTTKGDVCEAGTGSCICKNNFDGVRCDRCAPGYFGFPACYACDCSTAGSRSAVCDLRNGRCRCKPNYEGIKCDRCAPDYYGYPTCDRCNCNQVGSRSVNCDTQTGQCSCFSIYSGRSCDRCLPGFYGFPSCTRCNCNPAGTVSVFGRPGDCSTNNNGQCVCKANVRGLECNECKAGYFKLKENNLEGCEDCRCYQPGTNSGILSCKVDGQCLCKANVQGGRCKQCKDGYYNLVENDVFGCRGCNCDEGGSTGSTCAKGSGQCRCYPNLTGRRCNKLKGDFFFRDLHHIKIEMEEGFTPDGDVVRFDYQESKFPGFTWKGFTFINDKQPVVIVGVDVPTSCSGGQAGYYEIMFRYVMNQILAVVGKVTVSGPGATTQGVVSFVSTQKDNSVTSSYEKVVDSYGRRIFFKLTPGLWNIKIAVPNSRLLLDHVVLLPREYTEATYLKKRVTNACEVKTEQTFCNLFRYISLSEFQIIEAETPRRSRNNKKVHLFNDTSILDKLDFKAMLLLSPTSKQHDIMFKVARPGKYVAVLPYYFDSDESKFVDIFIRSREDSQRGKAWLYTCRYTFGCRAAVLEQHSRDVAIFNIKNTNVHLLSLISRNEATVAVDSIVLIPYEAWNLDYVTPRHYCLKNGKGKCTLQDYFIPGDVFVFRPQTSADEKRPSTLIDPDVKVKHLTLGTNVFKVNDLRAGNYHLIVHYYQPYHPSFEISVGIYSGTSTGLPGKFNLAYCPNLNGCRQEVKRTQQRSSAFVFIDAESKLRFSIRGDQSAWIEYVLFIPERSPYMTPSLFETVQMRLDKAFVNECAGRHFTIREDATKFCKESASSLTTGCNLGPAPCGCNSKGSTSSRCKEFGGQCPCRKNVIGRTCSRCKIGYYGFPNCKACNCSNCDDLTGRCTCAPGIIGDKCDRCAPGTFGYDAVIGCQPCNCGSVGTGTVDAVCNVVNGQCPCLESFGSRKCSVCAPGYYDYPRCLKCNCYVPGLTADKCDSYTGRCFCQDNVVGGRCSDCASGFFETRAMKPKVFCHKCWCNGRASTCTEAKLFRKQITSPNGQWTMSTEQITPMAIIVSTFASGEFAFGIGARYYRVNLVDYKAKALSGTPQIMYWVAPKEFLGNQVRSYGGRLSYEFVYSIKRGYVAQPLDEMADVILHSEGVTLHSTIRLKRTAGKVHNVSVLLKESAWSNDGPSKVSRNLFLLALSNLKSIHIRATHDENTAVSTITNVVMDSAIENGDERVHGIEKCNCHWGYTGLSCNLCADGYTRQKDGTCGKCQCSTRSRTCDPETGRCTNCTKNTDGEQCEKCKQGFYGDKCKPCECPSADPKNNFAHSCSIGITTGTLVCRCKEGYAGQRCEKCADGYYGEPEKKGGRCRKCLCSGNVDMKLTGNCDQKTGECYKCVNDTFGHQCEMCRPGFYGDAVKTKNCKDCKCDLCGSQTKPCNRVSGQCRCKKNVMGVQCGKCKPNTWNFHSCKGCEECKCGSASIGKDCNKDTGQCKCKPTVIGKRCDWCKLGYHGYSADGCKKCNCRSGGYCDVQTGKCVDDCVGPNCISTIKLCPPGHIIENGQCVECDSCVQKSLKRVHILISNITIFKDVVLPSGSVSLSTLDDVNKTLIRLRKESVKYESELKDLTQVLGKDRYGQIVCKDLNEVIITKIFLKRNISVKTMKGNMDEPITAAGGSTTFGPTTDTTDTTEYYDGSTTTDILDSFTTTDGPEVNNVAASKISTNRRSRRRVEEAQCPVSGLLADTQTKSRDAAKQVADLERDAYESKTKAKGTKRRAKDILNRLRDMRKKLDAILDHANSSLGTLGGKDVNEGDSRKKLKRAQEILKELQDRDFSSEKNRSKREKESAGNATIIADKLKTKADKIEERVGKINFNDLLEAFRHLKKSSGVTKGTADNAEGVVNLAKKIDYKAIIKMAKKVDRRSKLTMIEVKQILDIAGDALGLAKIDFTVFDSKKAPLVILIVKLRKFVKDLGNELDKVRPEVDESVRHAEKLTILSEQLKNELKDTNDFADTSLKAAKVYSVIVNAITEALRAAELANQTSYMAKEKAAFANEEAAKSKAKSEVVSKKVKATDEVKNRVRASLESVKKRIMDLKNLREKIQGRVDEVKDDIKEFEKEKLIGERAKNISILAAETKRIAEDGKKTAERINELVNQDKITVDRLKKERSKLNGKIANVSIKVDKVKEKIPLMEENINLVNRQHSDIQKIIDNDIKNDMRYVKFLIANARDVVDRVKLAMNFSSPSQFLVLDAPKAAYESSINTRISLIFRHNNEEDAMLLFMGNGSNPDGVGNGYLGFDIKNNKVRFHYKANAFSPNILTIPTNLETTKDVWYKVTATSNLNSYTLRLTKILSEEEIFVNEVSSDNVTPSPILTLGKQSELFIGTIPDGIRKPNAFSTKPLAGCMDKLIYNDEIVGLWDWKRSHGIFGCKRKGRKGRTGDYCFNGDGFVDFKIATSRKFAKVDLKFRTLEKDGLLILALESQKPGSAFYALEMINGVLVSKYNFGGGYKEITHAVAGVVNDGNTYQFTIRVKRRDRKIRTKIGRDTEEKKKEEFDIDIDRNTRYDAKKVYIGGVPMNEYFPPEVNTKGFTGCIGQVVLKESSSILMLIDNAFNYIEPEKPGNMGNYSILAHTASFPTRRSYLKVPPCSLAAGGKEVLSLGFTFQTFFSDGVIIKAPNYVLALEDGQIALVLGNGVKIKSENPTSFADGEWHTVSLVNKFGTTLTLGTDRTFISYNASLNVVFVNTGNMNVGGANGIDGFNGNIRELFCSAKEINLASGQLNNGVKVSSRRFDAPLQLNVPPTLPPPTKSTTTQPPPTTTQPPPTTTQPPATTTQPPATTTEPPSTTQPPTTTEKPMVSPGGIIELTTVKPPDTTQPPTTTTQPPAETTQPPPTTTQPPPTTTIPPTTTTQPPAATTEPPITTQPPTTTTEPIVTTPAKTTQPPAATTQPPIITTGEPPQCRKGVKRFPDAYGFGLSSESYAQFRVKRGNLGRKSRLEFYFYTFEPNGILLTANMVPRGDYESIYLSDGKVMYTFNAGAGPLHLMTAKKYNDGKWHKVETVRNKTEGYLNVEDEKLTGKSKGGASTVNKISKLYAGGVPVNAAVPARISKASSASLRGGIRDVRLFGEPIDPVVKKGVSEAYLEGLDYPSGLYVGKNGGYIEVQKIREVGFNYRITLDVRPRKRAGYMFYVAGKKDGLTILLQANGAVKAECDNGGGLFSVEVMPPTSICDGKFHSVSLVKKARTLILTVDGVSKTATATSKGSAANTGKSPVYLGGIPANQRPRGYEVFSGCIKNVKILGKTVDFKTNTKLGGSVIRGCGG